MPALLRFTEFFLSLSLIVLSLASSTHGQAGIITTVAGNGNTCSSATSPCGDGGPATQAQLHNPSAVAVDTPRHLFYIVDSNDQRVRRVDATANIITDYAGNGNAGYAAPNSFNCPNNGGPNPGDGGLAAQACLNGPRGVAVDQNGNVYISDAGNSRIRRIDFQSKTISTYAGSGTYGYCGDGGLAVQACLASPVSLAWDSSSNSLYIADSANQRIRKVDGSGVISTVAGLGNSFCAETPVAVDTCLNDPEGITVDGSGRFFYVADTQNVVIRKVDTAAIPATQTIVAGKKGSSGGPCPDGSPATGSCFFRPSGVAVDASGGIYIADREQTSIYLVSGGLISVAAGNGTSGYCGDGGPAKSACLGKTAGVVIASTSMYIADIFNQRIRMVNLGPSAFALSVSLNGTGGGTVTSNPAGIACPGTCSASFPSGSSVTLTATAINGWIFSGWSGACTGTGTCTVAVTAPKSVQATFKPVLSVSVGGTGNGTVTSSPAGISCPGTCSGRFTGGTAVTLTPTAASGSTFGGWDGACTGTGGCTVTMNAAQFITARFDSSSCAAGTCATITSTTVATSPPNTHRTTLGVGEVVNLTFSGSSATWSLTGTGSLNTTSGKQVIYRAGDVPGTAKIIAFLGTTKASIGFTVIAPSIAKENIVIGSYIHHGPLPGPPPIPGRPDIGFHAYGYLGPDTVSFYNVWFKEVEVNAKATGVYNCINGTGHMPSPPIHATTTVVKGLGTLIGGAATTNTDNVYSGDCGAPSPFAPGYEQYNIPWVYSLSQVGTYRIVSYAIHSCTLASDGQTLKASKAGTGVTKMVSSPSHFF